MATKIFLDKYQMRQHRNAEKEASQNKESDDPTSLDNPEEGHVVSKENLFLRETLAEMGKEFKEEFMLDKALFKADFFIPSANLAIEINGKSHYYPYTTRFNNFTNLKMKSVRGSGYNLMNLNSWILEGFIRNENREGLKDLLKKTITTYEKVVLESSQRFD